MARTISLNWESYRLGEDSAAAAVDPTSVPNGKLALLENLEPSVGRISPRAGSRKITKTTSVWWAGEYQKAMGGYFLMVDAGDLVAISYSGGRRVVKAAWLNQPCSISSVRVGKYLILLTDLDGESLVVYEDGGQLVSFPAYMPNELQAISSAWSQVVESNGNSWTGEERGISEGDKMPDFAGPFDAGAPRNFTYTWVRLEKAGGQQFDLTTGMPGAQLESWEDVGRRTQLTYCRFLVDGKGQNGAMGDLWLTFDPASAPAEATHLRVYMTLPATIPEGSYITAQEIANGLVYRWAADIPVASLGVPFKMPGTDGALAGSVNLCWSTGRDDIPPGGAIKFFQGRLVVYGGTTQENPGRGYFSSVIDGSTEQLSKLLSFRKDTDFVDTSTDESEPGVGMGLSQGYLVFFNSRSVYAWGGPDSGSPIPIDSTRGAVGGITEIGQRIFYLSHEGPAVVSGTTVDIVDTFNSDMTTPNLPGKSAFFEKGARITGMWHSGSWMLTDGQSVAAWKMEAGGTWRVVPGAPMSFAFYGKPVKDELWVAGWDKPVYSFMDRTRYLDGNVPFKCRLVTRGAYAPGGAVSAEAVMVRTGTSWTDASPLKVALVGDFGRVGDLYTYEEAAIPGAASGHTQIQRGEVVQVIRQGAMSHWFQVELEKFAMNRELLFGPIHLDMIPRNYHPEGISISDPGRLEPILDYGFLGWDPDTTEM